MHVLVVSNGGRTTERRLLVAFDDSAVGGKWFWWTKQLEKAINYYKENPDADIFPDEWKQANEKRKPVTTRTLRRRARKAAMERMLNEGSLTIKNKEDEDV